MTLPGTLASLFGVLSLGTTMPRMPPELPDTSLHRHNDITTGRTR
jgi:hypothetical protein